MTDRKSLSDAFVARAGWGDATRRFLAGDASPRSYDRLTLGTQTAVLMDAPPERGEETGPFVRMARHLTQIGLSAPRIIAEDADHGFLLLEDLGDTLYARPLEREPSAEARLYHAAVEVLAHLQSAAPPADLPEHSPSFMAEATGLSVSWYAAAVTGTAPDPTPLIAAMAEAMARHCTAAPVLVLRDYHAENLLWLPERAGLARVGLLDFQMGSLGQPEYDLVSLLLDARRDVDPTLVLPLIHHFADLRGASREATEITCAVLAAQRNLRILGGFTRLSLHFGKPGYVRLIPRVWAHVQTSLAHPALASLREIAAALPEPTPEALQRIVDLCGTRPSL